LRPTRTPLPIAAILAVALVGCSSPGKTSTPQSTSSEPTSSAASSTTVSIPESATTAPGDPNLVPNLIPFDVGEITARPNGWVLGVTKVVRPFAGNGLPALPSGQEYVAVDIKMSYDGTGRVAVDTRKIFGVNDQTGKGHVAIAGAQGTTGLDGTYAPGTNKSGQMVFAVPVKKQLLLLLNGPVIHTQRTIFQVDPPKHAPID